MNEREIYSKRLESCGYRQLQKMAKALSLPSNVKKINLIEMVIAKQFSSPAELEVIINRVKLDRLKASQNRWSKRKYKRTQASEVSSTSKHLSLSPAISLTPKRPGYILQFSPDSSQTLIKYQPPKSYLGKKATSDRILRSYNTKTPRPDYAMMDDLTIDSLYTKNTVNAKFVRPTGSNTQYNSKKCDFSILNNDSEASSSTNLTGYNTKVSHGYATEGSYNTKIVKTNLNTKLLKPNRALMERRSSIVDQSSLTTNFNTYKPGLNTNIVQPTSSKFRPTYAIMDRNNKITKIVRGDNPMRVRTPVPRVLLKRQSLLNSSVRVYNEEKQLIPMHQTTNTSSPLPAKRKRTVSGIYPIETQPNTYYECVQTVDYRHTDGKITKINALIQKPRHPYPIITVQDVINTKIDSQIFKTSNKKPADQITKAIEYKPITAATEKVSSISKENTQPISIDLSQICTEKTQTVREYLDEYLDFSTNITKKTQSIINSSTSTIKTMPIEQSSGSFMTYTHNTQPARQVLATNSTKNTQPISQSKDFSIENAWQYNDFSIGNTQPIRHNYSQTCIQNAQPIIQCNDLSTTCIENMQPRRQYDELSSVENTQPIRHIFSKTCIDNTKHISQYNDLSTTCIENIQPKRQYDDLYSVENTQPIRHDLSKTCTDNTQSIRQYNDLSTTCIEKTQSATQCNDFLITCIENTQPMRQYFIDSSSTPTYTNVIIKEMAENNNVCVYYHKKIRSEQMRRRFNEQGEVLPHINEVFSRFNEVQYRNLTQPLYVQVSQESERFPQYPFPDTPGHQDSAAMLESLYNFRHQLIVNEPLLKLASTDNTKCVFSAETVVCAEARPPSVFNSELPHLRVDPYSVGGNLSETHYGFRRDTYQRDFYCTEAKSPSISSIGTADSQELGTNVTVQEMVEDALELISQDGDYMERMGIEAHVQCVVRECAWAGSQLMLEYHVRQAHEKDILYKDSPDWSTNVTLGSLASHQIWLSHLVQYNENLYVVSAKYFENCIMVALTSLTETQQPKRGRITVYNKITGKPFTWEDEISFIPERKPYQCTENCLKIDAADLDLLPNSANLKLVNNKLKTSDTKAVVGQPSLDNIEVAFFVNILD